MESGPDRYDEAPAARLARNFNELLQELRVAQAGVQILFAFLLIVAFTDQYREQSDYLHGLHLATVLLAAASSALLIAPAAWHRVLFRRGRREVILSRANSCALLGILLLAGAMTGTVLMVTEVVIGGPVAIAIGACFAAMFIGLWFVLPRWLRSHDDEPGDSGPAHRGAS